MANMKPSVPDSPVKEAGSTSSLSGKKVTVEFLKTQDQEPRDIFVGVNEYQAQIKRGVRVTVPVEVFNTIKNATYTDKEEDPENPGREVAVEKNRYPYNLISAEA